MTTQTLVNAPTHSKSRQILVLTLLSLITLLNQADRVIMSVAGEAVKLDLELSDGQIGLLGGVAFSLLYSTMAVPIARLADRFDRWKLLSICLLLWSAMTAFCGAARSFAHLVFARAFVGVGEAGCSPMAHSLVGDYFPPKSRTTAIAILMAFISIGGLVGSVVGGKIIESYGWRSVFLILGLPGVVLAPICFFGLRDPFRRSRIHDAAREPVPTLAEVLKTLFKEPFWRHMFIAATFVMISSYSFAQFSAPFFIRRFSLGFGDAGLMYGLVIGVTGAVGSLIGGQLCDRTARLGMARYGWIPAAGMLLSAPMFIAGFLQNNLWAAAALIAPAATIKMLYMAPTFGLVQQQVAPRMRATASALLFMVIGLIGGLGPVITGIFIDMRAKVHFFDLINADYNQLCPGGRASVSALEQVRVACADALSSATGDALAGTCFVMLLAALHYLIAANLMRRIDPPLHR